LLRNGFENWGFGPKTQTPEIPDIRSGHPPLNAKSRSVVKAEKEVCYRAGDVPWEEAERALSSSSAIFRVQT
jgi:hypothetical protein